MRKRRDVLLALFNFMIELIKFLKAESSEDSLLDYNSLLFTFTSFLIFVEFEALSQNEAENLQDWFLNGDVDHFNIKVDELEMPLFSKLKILSLSITDYEYLGDRADIEDTNETKSISNKLYQVLSKINTVDKNAIEYYNLDINDGYDNTGYMCDFEPNFIFNIYIKESYYSNLDFFRSLLLLPKIEEILPSYFYLFFYAKNEKIDDSYKINILNTNTKSRRIGYLKLLATFFSQNQKVPIDKLNKKFEVFAIQYSTSLDSYKNSKGLIQKTKTGNSAQPYINLAYEIGWIISINNIALPSKQMKVYLELRKELVNSERNPFFLDSLDKIVFLETILSTDFLYFSIILELLFTKAVNSYKDLVLQFQKFVIFRLNEFSGKFRMSNETKLLKSYRIIQERIEKWTEPDTYLEHVLMPRINWLLDLDLVSMDKELRIELAPAGNRLFKHLCYWNDINTDRVINPKEFLKLFAVHVCDSIYNKEDGANKLAKEEIEKIVNKYINESFHYFKTLAPNRVTASQAITYTKYKMYLTTGVRIGAKAIENYLQNQATGTYIYKYQKQYDDGYIQKILKK
jgi:hypothetical protein